MTAPITDEELALSDGMAWRKLPMVESLIARLRAAEAETRELRDDWRRALRRAHDLTLETQTMEDAVTDLCRIVLQEREQKHAAEARAEKAERELAATEVVHVAFREELDRQHVDCESRRETAERERDEAKCLLAALRFTLRAQGSWADRQPLVAPDIEGRVAAILDRMPAHVTGAKNEGKGG